MKLSDSLIRIKNAFLYKSCLHFPYLTVRIWALKQLGHSCGNGVYFPADIIITQNFVNKRGHLILGDRVSIGPKCIFIVISHPNYSKVKDTIKDKPQEIIIENDAWIGAGAIILPGITVHEGAIVGAGAVVTKDVPAHTIVAGNPARELRHIEGF